MKKIKGKREKIDVILAVYTTKFELSIIFQNEKLGVLEILCQSDRIYNSKGLNNESNT